MKRKYHWRAWILIVLIFAFATPKALAQIFPHSYYQAGWQFNIPVASRFASESSGMGFYFDGGYYLTHHISIGGFLNCHSNSERISRRIYTSGTASLSTDQMQTLLQLPFGLSLRYRFAARTWQPYISVKLGANYSEATSVLRTERIEDRSWGFYASPEAGINIFPFRDKWFGFNIAAYYGYATNRSSALGERIAGLNNVGLRIGITF
ncbi:outer membrane beta-barrel protein [Bacteroides sp.]|uniref:outer membrane beta-barrel protein n=1 Tax=Bacteroides sp. TaxID=29523 RepID=UPI00402A126C